MAKNCSLCQYLNRQFLPIYASLCNKRRKKNYRNHKAEIWICQPVRLAPINLPLETIYEKLLDKTLGILSLRLERGLTLYSAIPISAVLEQGFFKMYKCRAIDAGHLQATSL